jgi:hypothetical protein
MAYFSEPYLTEKEFTNAPRANNEIRINLSRKVEERGVLGRMGKSGRCETG